MIPPWAFGIFAALPATTVQSAPMNAKEEPRKTGTFPFVQR